MEEYGITQSTHNNVFQVYGPRVPEIWLALEEGFQRAIDNSGGYIKPEEVYDNLVGDKWQLFVVADEESILGAAITEILVRADGFWCNIPFAFSADPEQDVHGEFLSYLEDRCKGMGFKGIKFISYRPGYQRKAKKLGYSQGYVEYVKEI